MSIYRFFLFAAFTTVLLNGCKKSDDASPKSAYDIVQEDAQFSILKAAVTQAGLADFLKGANLTIFAPNDAAFQASGYANAAAVAALPAATIKSVLQYHVLNGIVKSNDTNIQATGTTAIQTSGGANAYLYRAGTTLYINSAKVTQADREVANGVVHVIDKVLSPPTGSIVAAGQANPDLSLLLAAANRAASVNPTLIAALSGSVPGTQLTIFAPNNAAFIAAGYKDLATINATNPQTLANLLTYHGVAGLVFSPQLQPNTALTTLASGTNNQLIAGTGTGGAITIKGNANTTAATIKQADILTTNGIVHIIDQILKQ